MFQLETSEACQEGGELHRPRKHQAAASPSTVVCCVMIAMLDPFFSEERHDWFWDHSIDYYLQASRQLAEVEVSNVSVLNNIRTMRTVPRPPPTI